MKKHYYLIFVLFLHLSDMARAQYLDNQLEVFASGMHVIPHGSRANDLSSSTFPNYDSKFAQTINALYEIKNRHHIGIGYSFQKFESKEDRDYLFISEPKSNFLFCQLEYFYELPILREIKRINLGAGVGVGLMRHTIAGDIRVVKFDDPDNQFEEYTEYEFGINPKMRLNWDFSRRFFLHYNFGYQFFSAGNPLYTDKSFTAIYHGFGLGFKMLEDKKFQYD
ncbi:MAG: hypothetical protein ABJ004_14960 [Cyclobacteriaceae bacterium]